MNKILINIVSNSIGDNIAAIPYIDRYRTDNSDKTIYVKCNGLLKPYLKDSYPDLNFDESSNYEKTINLEYNFNLPIQKGYAIQLGYDGDEYIRPLLKFKPKDKPLKDKYVCMGVHSTMQMKYWNHPKGKSEQKKSTNWVLLGQKLRKYGFKPVVVEKDELFGSRPFFNGIPSGCIKRINLPFDDVLNHIYHSEFYIGLSSGLSWLAHSMNKKVVMISNFTEEWNEFDLNITDYKRITNKSVCHGCFNKINTLEEKKSVSNDWYYCPLHSKTNRQFECHTSITPDYVINNIKDWLV